MQILCVKGDVFVKYRCIFSAYDDPKLVANDLMFSPTGIERTIVATVSAKCLKLAFEAFVKTEKVDAFWSWHTTIYPFFMNKYGKIIPYRKQFELQTKKTKG